MSTLQEPATRTAKKARSSKSEQLEGAVGSPFNLTPAPRKKSTLTDQQSEALTLYKLAVKTAKLKSQDSLSHLTPYLSNRELNLCISRDGEHLLYFTETQFVKVAISTKKVVSKQLLPPELLPTHVSSVTFNHDETQILVRCFSNTKNIVEMIHYNFITGELKTIQIPNSDKRNVLLSKCQGYEDTFVYQCRQPDLRNVLKSYNLKTRRESLLACLDFKTSSLKSFIPCIITSLNLAIVISFNSDEDFFETKVYTLIKKKLVCRMRTSYTINRYISPRNKLTVMHYDESHVVFGVNVLLFFVDLKKKSCKVFSTEDGKTFAGVLRGKVESGLVPPSMEVVEFEGFSVMVGSADQLYTHKNKVRRTRRGEVRTLVAQKCPNFENKYKVTLERLSKVRLPPDASIEFWCKEVNAMELKSTKLGLGGSLGSSEIFESGSRTVMEFRRFDLLGSSSEVRLLTWETDLNLRYQFSRYTQPRSRYLVLFFIEHGFSLRYKIYDCLKHTLTESMRLIDDNGPMDFLELDDNLSFVLNFRFSGILTGNLLHPESFEVAPNTSHMFRSNMIAKADEKLTFYHLIDDFRVTRLEKVALRKQEAEEGSGGSSKKRLVPVKEIVFHNDQDFSDMKHVSNNVIASKRDDILYFFDLVSRRKRVVRVPLIHSISEILHFESLGERIRINLYDEINSKIFELVIEKGCIVYLKADPVRYLFSNNVVFAGESKLLQISDTAFYDLRRQEFVVEDTRRAVRGLGLAGWGSKRAVGASKSEFYVREEWVGRTPKLVVDVLSEVQEGAEFDKMVRDLRQIVSLGFKFSGLFGARSDFDEVFELLADTHKSLREEYELVFGQ